MLRPVLLARNLQSTTSLLSINPFQKSIPQSDINIYNHCFIDSIKVLGWLDVVI